MGILTIFPLLRIPFSGLKISSYYHIVYFNPQFWWSIILLLSHPYFWSSSWNETDNSTGNKHSSIISTTSQGIYQLPISRSHSGQIRISPTFNLKSELDGGWTNLFETYAQVKLDHETPSFGVKITHIWVATTWWWSKWYTPLKLTAEKTPSEGSCS